MRRYAKTACSDGVRKERKRKEEYLRRGYEGVGVGVGEHVNVCLFVK